MFFWAQTLNTDKHSQLFRVDADLWLGNVVITTLSPGCEKITSIPSFFILPFCITLNMLFGAVGAVDIGKNMPTQLKSLNQHRQKKIVPYPSFYK